MIYITQFIYVNEGQEQVFDEFEKIAIPAILKYNGRLLLRVRPDEYSFIEHHMARPYEIHFVEFDSEDDFENFKHDKERAEYVHLKEQSVKESIMVSGTKIS